MKFLLVLVAAVVLWPETPTVIARQWNDREGEFSAEAEFVSFKEEKVYLEKKDGSVVAVPMENLSYADYDYLRTLASSNSVLSAYLRSNILPTEHTVYINSKLPGSCNSMDFSPDGRWLAIGTDQGLLIIDRTNWETVTTLAESGFQQYIKFCRFTPDGKRLITGQISGPIKVWQFNEGASLKMLREYKGHGRTVTSLAFGPDGKHVLSGDENHALRYWNLESGEDLQVFKDTLTGYVSACTVNPKGTQALATGGKFLILFDLTTGKPIQKMALTSSDHNPSAISSNGSLIATARSSEIHCWKTVEGTELPTLKIRISANVVAFSDDGKYLAVGGYESAHLWSVADQKLIHAFPTAARFSSRAIAFSPDSQYFAVCSGAGSKTVQVFQIPKSSGS